MSLKTRLSRMKRVMMRLVSLMALATLRILSKTRTIQMMRKRDQALMEKKRNRNRT